MSLRMEINMPVSEFLKLCEKLTDAYPGAAIVQNNEDILKIQIGKNMFLEFRTIGEFKNYFSE